MRLTPEYIHKPNKYKLLLELECVRHFTFFNKVSREHSKSK
jgi:hypothetical protein